VLFNRFLHPASPPKSSRSAPRSTSRAPPTDGCHASWIALLRGRVTGSLAGTGGVEVAADVARYLLAGADAVMTTSALLRHGPAYATELFDGLATWMARQGFIRTLDVGAS
jgi:dihydroorotate dehydrogenase (fumarate)